MVRVGNSVPQQMKILLIQLKRIGDLILTTPAVAAVPRSPRKAPAARFPVPP